MSRWAEALVAVAGAALLAAPAAQARDPETPAANRTPDAEDVALTPLTDLNLRKDAVPAVLLAALADPYGSTDLRKCADVAAALEPLEAALGPDMDVHAARSERLSPGVVAKSVVSSFIPFRGIVREVTGAAEHQRTYQAAIHAGAVRRGFLKGVGQQMKCPYPARPAFARMTVAEPAAPAKRRGKSAAAASAFVSQPVVQGEAMPTPPVAARRK